MTKSCDWSYEEEYRILCMVDAWKVVAKRNQDFLELYPHQIKWICAGVRTPKEDIEELRRMVEHSIFPNAHVVRASLHPAEFEIELPKECIVSGYQNGGLVQSGQ